MGPITPEEPPTPILSAGSHPFESKVSPRSGTLLWLIRRHSKDVLNIPSGVKNSDNLQGIGFVPVDHQIGIDQEERVPLIHQLPASGQYRDFSPA